ncbi:MAG: peptidylprolyl isomerase [Candidatus Parcubacteria bacterium]|nr:peptidylprolyl isomerase [Candidatus Parcubacteria bacterium]
MEIFKRAKKIKTSVNLKALIIGILISLGLALVVFAGIIYWGFYLLDWRGNFMVQVSQILPLPAATVDGQTVLYKDYINTLNISRKFYESQTQKGIKGLPADEEVQTNVINRLIEDRMIINLARKYNIRVTKQEISDKMEEIIQNKGTREETEKFLKDFYGIDIKTYEHEFIEPNLWYNKTDQAIRADETINGPTMKKIHDALNDLKNNKSFEETAKQYSEGDSAATGGVIGNFLRGELPKDIEDKLFSMNEGEYTDILTVRNTLQIIRLEKKDEAKGVLTLSAISAKIKTVDDVVKEAKEKAQIKIYALSE